MRASTTSTTSRSSPASRRWATTARTCSRPTTSSTRCRANARPDTREQERNSALLVEALGHFGVDASVTGTVAGPHVTRYELRLAPGIKMSKVAQLKDDLAYALAA